ncbi:hypothetical protein PFISCL1PPCAC_19771 [Pristionchus fissidentatus]|uniref:Zoo-1 n=1 Tax=Pristionchus fissidentatus TaxID=1538716 RepID=A0AAV5W923_9BILA|nr:hypothetical protein PFISCL1PPCAC_19771 [Pristionchus fissidentatus]
MDGMGPGSDWTPSSDEVYVNPVEDDSSSMASSAVGWQLLSVSLHRAAQLGFGIAISGGIDNPLFTSGEGTVVISDVVPNGPASGLLQLNDRILSANGISFDSIPYARAVEVIKHSQHINMIVKRRVPVPVMEFEQRTLKFTLTKSRKKDDFGIVLGCKFYIKEIRNSKLAEKDPGLREGDTVLRVNGQSLDGIGLDEASKWLERSREKLCLVIQRDVRRGASRWPSSQTVYERLGSVAATPRHSPSPLMHVPLSARSSHEYINKGAYKGGEEIEGRMVSCSPMIGSTTGGQNSSLYDYQYSSNQSNRPDDRGQRTVCFHKVGGSVGIRVVGGNEVGVFVSAVAADSPAARHGVCPGDRIIEVNGRSMNGVTREGAVQLLMGLEERVILRLEYASSHLEYVRQSQIGDNFFVRAHFTKEKKGSALELSINEGDIFHVTDTLFGGTVGLWQASRVYSSSGKGDSSKGVIPNLSGAENLAKETRRANEERDKSRGTLLRRKLESRRTKSLPKNIIGSEGERMGVAAYERVVLNTPTFPRPVVVVGPLADVARRLLLTQFALLFSSPMGEGVIRLPAVDSIIANGKHCILDITMESVERLQMAQYAPIVILIDVESRSRLREIRKKMEAPRISSKLLAEETAAIKKNYSHLLSATVDASQEEGWLEAVRDLIGHLQLRRLWIPEMPCIPLEDMLLFTNTRNEKDCDSERDRSIHHDYIEYSDDVNKSIYQWKNEGHSSLKIPSSNGSEMGRSKMGDGWEERERGRDHSSHSHINMPSMSNQRKWNDYESDSMRREEEKRLIGGRDTREADKRKGYYNVQQLLQTDKESKFVSELAGVSMDGRGEEGERGDEKMRSHTSLLKWRIKDDAKREVDVDGTSNSTRLPSAEGGVYSHSSDCSPPIPNSSSGVSSESRSDKSPGEKPAIPPKTFIKENNNGAERSREGEMTSNLPSSSRIDPKEEEGMEESRVIEEATGWMGPEGGLLSCPVSNVHLIVPRGAIRHGEKHEIYVKVCEDEKSDSSPVDRNKGEELLSPLVICGPQGLTFEIPVELRLPHGVKEGNGEDWKFSLKTGDGEEWKQMEVNPHANNNFILLPIHKF